MIFFTNVNKQNQNEHSTSVWLFTIDDNLTVYIEVPTLRSSYRFPYKTIILLRKKMSNFSLFPLEIHTSKRIFTKLKILIVDKKDICSYLKN